MDNVDLERGKIYNAVLSLFRLLLTVYFVWEFIWRPGAGPLSIDALIKLVVLGLYVLGTSMMPVNKTALYMESVAILLLTIYFKNPLLISFFVFPISVSTIVGLSKWDVFVVPAFVIGTIFFHYGWNRLAFGYVLALFAFFVIKEIIRIKTAHFFRNMAYQSMKKEEKIRDLQAALASKEKENEVLMQIFIRTKSLNEKIEIDELINELLEAPQEFLNAEFVALYVSTGEQYRLLKTEGTEGKYEIKTSLSFKEGNQAIISQKQMRIPIKLDKKNWGVLDIFGRREEIMNGQKIFTDFTDDDYVTMATYIGQVMFSVKHAKLIIEMEKMANTDPLTRIANRRSYEKKFYELLKYAEQGNELALIMLDIDDFKRFNDIYGHEKGDEVLIAVADFLGTQIRKIDFLARTGGEEFSILVPGDNKKAYEIASNICKKVRYIPFVEPITLSLGISYYGIDGKTMDEMIRKADAALYLAKENGKDQVVEYHKGLQNRDEI